MKLQEGSLPLSFSLEDTVKSIEELLEEKDWADFKVAEIKLEFTPFYVFYYDAFFEAIDEDKKEKVVSETAHGREALNTLTSELDEGIASAVEEGIELVKEIKELPKNIPFIEYKTKLGEEDAKKIAQVKVAEKLGVGKENVIIHQLEKLLFPVWLVWVEVEGTNHELIISGTDGSLLSEDTVPVREKGFWELTQETMQELKDPKEWAKYPAGIISSTVEGIKATSSEKGLLFNRRFQILILVIILIIVVLWNYNLIKLRL